MSKVDILRLDSVTTNDTRATALINTNFQNIQNVIETLLSRTGIEPNYMDAVLDMNSYRIINTATPTDDFDVVNLKYLKDYTGNIENLVSTAIAAAETASSKAVEASNSAENAAIVSSIAVDAAIRAETAAEILEDANFAVDLSYSDNTLQLIDQDGNSLGTAQTIDSLPDQEGNSGKFLTTDGTDASWDNIPTYTGGTGISISSGEISIEDPVLINTSSAEGSLSVAGSASSYTTATNVGYSSTASAQSATAYGNFAAATGFGCTAIGMASEGDGSRAVALGYNAHATDTGAVQIGGGTNTEASTVKIGDNVNNWKVFDINTGYFESDRIETFSGTDGVDAGTKGLVVSPAITDLNKCLKGDGSWGASMGVPSSSYDELVLGATGTQYDAPANGWFVLTKNPSSAGQVLALANVSNAIQTAIYSNGSTGTYSVFIPVKKGDKALVGYTFGGSTGTFRFVYAEDDK